MQTSYSSDNNYKEVRGLTRGLQLLKALNASPGGIATTTELGRACSMHRTTVKRLMETLRAAGLVRQGERDGQYYLTFEVRRLSEGFEDEDWVSQVATPHMRASVKDLLWPCMITTLEGAFMVVRESTHRWSTLSQHHAVLGLKLPMLVTAVGRAYLAACQDEERDMLLKILAERGDETAAVARNRSVVMKMVRETRRRGYAVNDGEWSLEEKFSAIAVPVFCGPRLLAAINIVFPQDVVSPKDLKARYATRLTMLAHSIGSGSRSWIDE